MSVWVAEEILRRSLRLCSSTLPWQHILPVTASVKGSSFSSRQLLNTWATKQSETCLARSAVNSVRFNSQDSIHSGNLEAPSLPAENQTNGQKQSKWKTPFSVRLERCGSPSDVLDLTAQYAPTTREVSNCLNHMWSTTKQLSDEQKRCEVQLMYDHPEFEKLLQQAMKNVNHMRCEDLSYSLIGMVNLGLPQHSRVVQTFLRACQEKLNDFDERSLSILGSCLARMGKDIPNVAALKDGMRLVVDARLPDIKTVMALQTLMRVVGEEAPVQLKKKLEAKALSMTDQFSLPNSQHMVSTLATMGFHSKPLLEICCNKMKENLSCIPINRLYRVLLACKQLQYRNNALLSDISDFTSSMVGIWSNKQLILFLVALEKLRFCPTALLEALAEKVIANPDDLTLKDLLCVLRIYTSVNYDMQQKQQFVDSLLQALDSYLPKMLGSALLRTVYSLSLLGHFPFALWEQLLEISTLERLKSEEPKYLQSHERMFQTLDLCLRLDRPPFPRPLSIPRYLLGETPHSTPSVKPWLLDSLRSLLGEQADTMLQEMVVVENSYVIDGVITKPLPNQSSASEASDREACSPAESSQKMAIICPSQPFYNGSSNPRGTLAVKIRHLKILGYNRVFIVESALESMSEAERMEFLRRLIFLEDHSSDTQLEVDQQGS